VGISKPVPKDGGATRHALRLATGYWQWLLATGWRLPAAWRLACGSCARRADGTPKPAAEAKSAAEDTRGPRAAGRARTARRVLELEGRRAGRAPAQHCAKKTKRVGRGVCTRKNTPHTQKNTPEMDLVRERKHIQNTPLGGEAHRGPRIFFWRAAAHQPAADGTKGTLKSEVLVCWFCLVVFNA
jgi:hypothetical protein